MITLLVLLLDTAIIAAAVLAHYAILARLYAMPTGAAMKRRRHLLLSVFGAILAHLVAIWLFAVAYHLLIAAGLGRIEIAADPAARFANTMSNCLYFSIVNYTSLGYGDLVPHRHLAPLAGLEALTGLILIAWTASFLFAQMRRHWDGDNA